MLTSCDTVFFLIFKCALTCVCLLAHMCTHMSARVPEASDLSKAGVRGCCELPNVGAGNRTLIFWKRSDLHCWSLSPSLPCSTSTSALRTGMFCRSPRLVGRTCLLAKAPVSIFLANVLFSQLSLMSSPRS